jgi:outer membrane lipoprotein SlyB
MARRQTLLLFALSALAAPTLAGEIDGNAAIGGAIGGATGAAVGSAIGGREGAIIGGAIGEAAGAAIATDSSKEERAVTKQVIVEKEVVYVPAHHDNGRHRGHHKDKRGRDDD